MNQVSTIFSLIVLTIFFGMLGSEGLQGQNNRLPQRKAEEKPVVMVPDVQPEDALFIENFDYAAGTLTTVSGGTWINFSGTGNFIQVSSGGLTYTGYPGSGVGNKADIISVGTSAEDAYRQFTTQTSGKTYAAFLVNVANLTGLSANASTTGDYFAGFLPSSSTTALNARVSIRLGATAGTYQLGLRATTNNAAAVFHATELTPGTTYLVVLSYELVAGNSNDPINMWVNPAIGGSEPAPSVTQTTATATDNADIARFFLRQGTTTTPNASVDGIRVGTSWEDVTSGGGGGPAPTSKIFETYLNGANEVGGVATNGLGYGRVILNDAETQITASFYWENLTSGTTIGHIHQAPVGVNGPIIFDMSPTPGLTSGSTLDRVFAVTPAQVAELRAGNYYFNIHTVNFGGGEIRGQLRVADATVDFDGDGRSDFAVMRDTNGNAPGGNTQWYINLNASANFYTQAWGNGFALTFFENVDSEGVTFVGDAPTPADFDGDGKMDIAVWRNEAQGTFYILNSSNNTIRVDPLGILNDIPTVVGDYNGDGKADPAVYRRSAGPSTWYYRPSPSSNFVAINHGNTTDIPAPGDYDGDGKADPAVLASGTFSIALSTGGVSNVPFGSAGDLPVPGDFDGDGKTDLAVFRNVSGFWQWDFDPSGTVGTTHVLDSWGIAASDIPVRGDYNGDGKADYAIWRPGAQAEFFVMTPVTRQISSRPWGLAGDIPPAAAVGF